MPSAMPHNKAMQTDDRFATAADRQGVRRPWRDLWDTSRMKSVPILIVALLCSAAILSASDVAALHERYMQASISHDLKTLRTLTAEDATWQLGPRLLKGREEVLGPNGWDAGMLTSLQYEDVRVDGNVVEITLLESSEVLRALGVEVVHHYPRFVFEGGKLKRKEPWKPSPDMAKVSLLMRPLRKWIREMHPEALRVLLDESGTFVFNQEAGELMSRLALQWVSAGRPGGE